MRCTWLVALVALAASPTSGYGQRPDSPRVRAGASFDATGWTLLGTQRVDGNRDHDTILVGAYQGKFDELTIVVSESDLDLRDVTIVFGNGDRYAPTLRHVFKENQRSRAIDLPGADRKIAKIELAYENVSGGASVSIYGRERKASKARFDPSGWLSLGSKTVAAGRQRWSLDVGKARGKFSAVTLLVLDAELEVEHLAIRFDNGARFAPRVKRSFTEGDRSRTFELPDGARYVSTIEIVTNGRPGTKPRVEIFGRGTDQTPAPSSTRPAPVVAKPGFDARGWSLLGTHTVDGKRDRDTLRVSAYRGGVDQLTMVVSEGDLELSDFTIVFRDGKRWSPQLKHVFRENTRTRVIDLPGLDRKIARIELAYGNLRGGGKARVEIYARDAGRPAPAVTPARWESKGWTLLGKTTVDGWRDRDRLAIKGGRAFTEVMFVASGADLALHDVVITFANRETYSPPTRLVFKANTRTSPIDLPGNRRAIRAVAFEYSDLPGGGRASIEVWGRLAPEATKPRAR